MLVTLLYSTPARSSVLPGPSATVLKEFVEPYSIYLVYLRYVQPSSLGQDTRGSAECTGRAPKRRPTSCLGNGTLTPERLVSAAPARCLFQGLLEKGPSLKEIEYLYFVP